MQINQILTKKIIKREKEKKNKERSLVLSNIRFLTTFKTTLIDVITHKHFNPLIVRY